MTRPCREHEGFELTAIWRLARETRSVVRATTLAYFDPLRIKLTNVQSVTQSESPPGPAVTLGIHWYHCRSLADCMPSRCVTLRNARCSFPTVALSRCTVSCTQTTAGFIAASSSTDGCAVAK